MRNERINKSTPELDKLEHDWWNEYTPYIEKIWAQSYELQKLIRKHYLKRAGLFFKQSGKQNIRILELGCGSGWVGRHIASKEILITGTDFSEEQIKLASELAHQYHLNSFCKYEVADSTNFPKDFDGILLHSFLHHLSTEELNFFFTNLANVQKGTRVFMYEPVFHKAEGEQPSFFGKLMLVAGDRYLKTIKKIISVFYKKNSELSQEFTQIYESGKENGWHFSPKEVPFYEGELMKFIEKDFNLERSYCVSRIDYQIGLELVFHNQEKPGFLFRSFFLPLATWFDKRIFSLNYRYFMKDDFLFTCYEFVRK